METVFLKILNMSIAAGWLVLAVLLMRLLLKKAPRYLTVIMWAIVGIRLVLPFSFESVLSLIPSTETVPPEILLDRTPEIQTGIDVLNGAVNPIISESFAPEPMASVNPLQILTLLAGWVWIIGMVGMVVYTLISYLRIWRRVRESAPLRENIWVCDRIDTPFILGILRPRIYLPSVMEGSDIPFVLAHEQAHLKRKDHLWKPLGFLLLTIHWFNPLLWVAYILLCRDIETACDEKVLKTMGEDIKKPYSMALINCSVPRKMITACPLAFGEVSVKNRIKKVLNYKKPAFWLLIVAVVVCIVLSVCFLTNPTTVNDQMQVFLDCQIAEHFQTEKSEGNACCLDYEILGTRKHGKTTTVYMWVLYEEYNYQNGKLQQVTGSHIPTVITARKEDGSYRLVEYFEPRDGAYNPGDIKAKFPWYLWPKAMDSQRYYKNQQAACLEMAEQYFKENPPGLDSTVPPAIIDPPTSLYSILDFARGLIDSTIFDIDGDGKAELCELHYGGTSGLFTFILAVYEQDTLEYCSCYTDNHNVLSFAQQADGTMGIHYASSDDAAASGFYEIKIENRIIRLLRDDSQLLSWNYEVLDDLDHLKQELEDKQEEYYEEHLRKEGFLVFRYNGVLPDSVKDAADATGLIVDYLYIYDAVQKKIVQVSDSASTEFFDYNCYWSEVCFVPEEMPYSVRVVTYNRELGKTVGEHTPFQVTRGKITALQYHSTDDGGVLLVCKDGQSIVSYDMVSLDNEILMEAYSIEEFYYSPSSLFSKSFTENVSSEEMGDVIYWRGKLTEQDPVSTYYYIVQKDEHWAEKDWTAVPTEPKVAKPNPYGYPFIFNGSNPSMQDDADISGCVEGYVYWYNVEDKNIFFVTDKPVVQKENMVNLIAGSETHVYFVTEEEPTKIYAAPLEDFSKQEVIYESTHGKIDRIITGRYQYTNTVLQITEGGSRFVWFDLTQNKAELFMEQYFLLSASIETSHNTAQDENGDWYLESTNVIYFIGKLNAADDLSQYLYYRDTGKIEEVFWQ